MLLVSVVPIKACQWTTQQHVYQMCNSNERTSESMPYMSMHAGFWNGTTHRVTSTASVASKCCVKSNCDRRDHTQRQMTTSTQQQATSCLCAHLIGAKWINKTGVL